VATIFTAEQPQYLPLWSTVVNDICSATNQTTRGPKIGDKDSWLDDTKKNFGLDLFFTVYDARNLVKLILR